MKKKSIILLVIFVIFNCFIFAEALMPGDSSGAQSDSIANVFSDIIKNAGKDEFDYIKPTKIEVTSDNTMFVGDVKKLETKITPSDTTNTAKIFKSLNPDFATVDINGNVRALKKGEATIRVICDDDNAIFVDFKIIINEKEIIPPTEIRFKNGSVEIKNKRATYIRDIIGEIEYFPSDCTDRNVRYEVVDSNATIDGDYLLTNEPGELTLKAILNSNESIFCEMKVIILQEEATKPDSISIGVDRVYVNRYTEIDVTFNDENIDDRSLKYIIESDSNTIASYSINNGLRGIKEGKGTIRACSIYNSSVCSNKVEFEVEKVQLENLEIKVNEFNMNYFKAGEKINFTYNLYPSDVTYKDIEWSVSNDNARISQSGLLVGLKEGTTIVTLKHLDSGLKVTRTVNVAKASALTFLELEKLKGHVRKQIGHFGLFAIDGIIGFLFFMSLDLKKRDRVVILVSTGIALGVIAELLQLIPKGRNCNIVDMVINSSGFMSGVLVSFIALLIIRKVRTKKDKEGGKKDE